MRQKIIKGADIAQTHRKYIKEFVLIQQYLAAVAAIVSCCSSYSSLRV